MPALRIDLELSSAERFCQWRHFSKTMRC